MNCYSDIIRFAMNNMVVESVNDTEVAKSGAAFLAFLGFIYHFIFLFIFLALKVKPMFYFNIGSVVLFMTCTILILTTKLIRMSFVIATIEVILHQVLAEYYIGIENQFHFFMLIVSETAFLIFRDKRKWSIFFCILPTVGFIVMEILRNYLVPVYTIPAESIARIRAVNILSFVFMFVYRIYSYVNTTYELEYALANKVSNMARKMQNKNEEIIRLQNNMIFSLSNLVENRDRDTGKHIQRTSAYVKLLAVESRNEGLYSDYLTDDKIALLEQAAPMHDIGKIVVPDSILKKPGRLTEEEFSEMQKHAHEGGRIINKILGSSGNSEYVQIASEIASNHHEKWNGTGYPNHKSGTDIPLSARIMAVADVFDALVSVRCYKEPMADDVAFGIIEKEAGTHFDPDLAKIFVKNRDKVLEIKERLRD